MPSRSPDHAVDPQGLFRVLLDALPLHAEEDAVREIVPEHDLVVQLSLRCGSADAARLFVVTIRRLLDSLGLLNHPDLLEGAWSFVSFPASLLARSILETLATEDHSFVDPGHWAQAGRLQDELIEGQREILRRIEIRRVSSHSGRPANPIRTVHVAWGLIKLGGRFPLKTREDRERPGFGRFVFPGGRLRVLDLPLQNRSAAGLRKLYSVSSPLANAALATTLARELDEELDLKPDEYDAKLHRNLSPYQKLEGAANSHAYSNYNVGVFVVNLTRSGTLKVLDRVGSNPTVWAWFSPSEIAVAKRADGKSAFVDALMAEFGNQVEQFLRDEVPDSGTIPPAYTAETDAVDLPRQAGEPLIRGASGKERPLHFSPTQREWELLMVLGWHCRGLEVRMRGGAITQLGGGWLRLNDADLIETSRGMARRLDACGFPVLEVDSIGHCRLSIESTLVYFHPELFEYRWLDEDEDKSVLLRIKEIDTTWATLVGAELRIRLTKSLTRNLRDAEDGKVPEGDISRECRTHFESAKALGLRKFISTKADIGVGILVPRVSL